MLLCMFKKIKSLTETDGNNGGDEDDEDDDDDDATDAYVAAFIAAGFDGDGDAEDDGQ